MRCPSNHQCRRPAKKKMAQKLYRCNVASDCVEGAKPSSRNERTTVVCVGDVSSRWIVSTTDYGYLDALFGCSNRTLDHCPWVNNCVGIGNHKYFLLFVFYTFLSCLYSFTLVMTRFYSCMSRHGHVRSHHLTCLDYPTQLLPILGLVVESILFGMFTACMMVDQSSVVWSKMTHIDRLKGGEDETGSTVAGVVEVFGLSPQRGNDPRFRSDWLSPFAKVCFPSSVENEVMGFCRPCSRSNDPEQSPRSGNIAPMIRSVAEIV